MKCVTKMVTHFFLLLLSNQHKNIYNKINLQEIERGMKALEFGEKLRAAREKKRITQQTLADYLFATRQTVSRWECGTRFPDLLTAKKISGILEVSLDELLSEEDSVKFVEENQIISSSTGSVIQAGLYGFSGMCFIIFSVLWSTSFILDFMQYDQIIPMTITRAFNDFSMTFLMILGFILSVKERLTPKNTSILPILYSIFKILMIFTTNYYQMTECDVTMEMVIIILISVIFYLFNIIAIVRYFIKDINLYRYYIYEIHIIIIIERVIVFAQKPIWDFIQFKTIFLGDFIIDVLLLFGNITFGLLVIYQTYTLYKKRYQITKYDRI